MNRGKNNREISLYSVGSHDTTKKQHKQEEKENGKSISKRNIRSISYG